MPTRVLADANVLYSRTLRDWLAMLYLESDSFFSVYWTEDIVAEVLYHLRRLHPKWSGQRTAAVHDKICRTFEGGRVDDFTLDPYHHGNDPNDHHVHAAAIACGASILLTADRGFSDPSSNPADLPYEIYHPDDFFLLVDDSSPDIVRSVICQQQIYWVAREGNSNLPRQLRAAGCEKFAERVRQHLQTLPQP